MMTRRGLAALILSIGIPVLYACDSAAAPTPEKPTSATAPAAAPASAPAATPATATSASETAATPAAPPAEALGIQPLPFSRIVEIVQKAQGQVVFFHVYASWCGPCRVEFPEVVELGKRYRAQGLKMVLVSVDERRGDLETFLRPHNANMVSPAYLMTGPQQEFATGLRTLGAHFEGGIPYTAVYGRDGKLVTEWTGSRNMAHFERVIQPLL